MEKVLKKYTTIPQHLYVYRKADKQLESIIDDMQRPGYVLVARQMGKTNLLFNAKRCLESDSRLFCYVDMSNVFKKERECYQSIIDSILEPNEELFSSIEDKIYSIRAQKLPPHREYTKSLRIILEYFQGNVVIILDEIDALKTADYSDNIFAQIRSNYFSRTNFPVFERLTYVLSGVIEPIELIKDRNKSPFNIGDKIYLDDFTKDEFLDFFEMSKLELPTEISDFIYSWTSGNPRLTFDVCSEVESEILRKGTINESIISNIIEKKYLTSFDIAPVDHIRELVKSNSSVINALIEIHSGNAISLSDEIKKKLYLYGIITSNFDEESKFKNLIIEKSLSLNWLETVKKEHIFKNLSLAHGLAFFDKGEYVKAIEVFQNLLAKEKEPDYENIKYLLGYSYYKTEQYELAIEQFSYKFETSPYESRAICFTGICNILIGKIELGTSELKSLLGDNDKFSLHNALLNLARIQDDSNNSYALNLLEDLYGSAIKGNDRLYCFASLYDQSEIYNNMGNTEKSLELLNKSIEFSDISEEFFIKFKIASISDNNSSIKSDIVSLIIDNKLNFDTCYKSNELGLHFDETNLIRFLNFIFDSKDNSLFITLLKYSASSIYKSQDGKCDLIYRAAMLEPKKLDILLYLLSHNEHIEDSMLISIYREICIYFKDDRSSFLEYFPKFDKASKKSNNISEVDLYVYTIALEMLYTSFLFQQSFEITSSLESRLLNQMNKGTLLLASSAVYFWKAIAFNRKGDQVSAYNFFRRCTEIINKSKFKDSIYFNSHYFNTMKDHENKLKECIYSPSPLVKKSNFSQRVKSYTNKEVVTVKYSDGRILKGKYKKFKNDIRAQECEIIS